MITPGAIQSVVQGPKYGLYTVVITRMGVGITLDRLGVPVIGVYVGVVAFQIAWALQVG